MFLLTLLVAGNETTRTLLSGSALVLHEHPDQRAALAADPALVPGGVEECLRWVTPVHAFCRTATEDAVVAGRPSPRATTSACSTRRPTGTSGSSATTRHASTCDGPPTRCISPSASASTCASAPAWPAWRRGSSSRSCWRAFPRYEVTGHGREGRVDHGRRASARSRWCWLPAGLRQPGGRHPGSTAWRSSSSSDSTAAGSALSRSRPPWRSERTRPFSRSTLTCMLTVGWASRKSMARSPTVLGASASECRMASRVGSATALSRRATDSVRARADDVVLADAGADDDDARELEVHAGAEEEAGDEEQLGRPASTSAQDVGEPRVEDVTTPRYQ